MYIVTGGGSGIGQSLALALALREQPVLIVGRREQPLLETARQSSYIEPFVADLSTESGRSKLIEYIPSDQNINALINNAGLIEPIAPIRDIKLSDWHQAMATNLDAPLFLTQGLYSRLENGRVLNIGSAVAYFPVEGWAAYCVSKAALSMLTRSWQLESQKVTFASVMPGIIDTPMQATIRASSKMDEAQRGFYQKLKDQHRLVSSETVGTFLCWLLMDTSNETYASKEWDIYDRSHHDLWLQPSQQVPHWEDE